ncbi:MAG TPA: hypothetical protein VJR89_19810, partial [Polyangiales bacterium]|nr:hypothetical protein [Polyangiales bacterium]
MAFSRSSSVRLLSFVVACSVGWISSAAQAAPGAAERETARSLMVEGDRLSALGDFRGALARYQSAHALMHVPTTGWSVARTYAQLGQLVEARAVAIEVINIPLAPDEPA